LRVYRKETLSEGHTRLDSIEAQLFGFGRDEIGDGLL
jgi:hypothetical protein